MIKKNVIGGTCLMGNDHDEFNMEILSVSKAIGHPSDHIFWVAAKQRLHTHFKLNSVEGPIGKGDILLIYATLSACH